MVRIEQTYKQTCISLNIGNNTSKHIFPLWLIKDAPQVINHEIRRTMTNSNFGGFGVKNLLILNELFDVSSHEKKSKVKFLLVFKKIGY